MMHDDSDACEHSPTRLVHAIRVAYTLMHAWRMRLTRAHRMSILARGSELNLVSTPCAPMDARMAPVYRASDPTQGIQARRIPHHLCRM